MTRTDTLFDRVEFEPNCGGTLTVWTVWKGVDRPKTSGLQVADTVAGRKLAARLKLAIEAGATECDPTIETDRFGQTYVRAKTTVLGRTLNADLKRLGF
jgi:hypothetical protein